MTIYPNQKVITIHKDECNSDFLQINNLNWQIACSYLTYTAFKLYLYLASNKNGYMFALSYEAINNAIPMSRKSYDKAIGELKVCGYLKHVEGNDWEFSDKV